MELGCARKPRLSVGVDGFLIQHLLLKKHQCSHGTFCDICQVCIISQRKDSEFRRVNKIQAGVGSRLIGDGPSYSDYK